ncbi:hypothetical protein [Bosea sp. 2RAB26]|uniref:hypothetical protein n=1 Tax=Bosea sp. 2RAB26 TaxID=3237476 RepID=UPI003F923157
MAVQEGTYKAEFGTVLGIGSGVVVICGGKVRGGNSAMLYVGSYQEDRDAFSAEIRVTRHTPTLAVESVFGKDDVSVSLTGVAIEGTISLLGESPDAPGVKVRVTLVRVAD